MLKTANKLTLWVIAGISAVLLPVRIWQLSACIDYETGFFTSASGFGAHLLYILLGVQLVLTILLIIRDSKLANTAITCKSGDFSPNQVLLLGIFMLAGSIFCFVQLVLDFSRIDLNFIGNVLVFLAYLITAFLLLGNKKIKPAAGIAVIILPISYTVKAGALFMKDTVIVRISDELLLMLSYVAAVMLFLAVGRFLSDSEGRHSRHKLIFFAAAAFALSTVSTAVKYPMYLVGNPEATAQMTPPSLSELGVWAVSLGILVLLYQNKQTGAVQAEASAGEEADGE